jgi:hypothetical protein
LLHPPPGALHQAGRQRTATLAELVFPRHGR